MRYKSDLARRIDVCRKPNVPRILIRPVAEDGFIKVARVIAKIFLRSLLNQDGRKDALSDMLALIGPAVELLMTGPASQFRERRQEQALARFRVLLVFLFRLLVHLDV